MVNDDQLAILRRGVDAWNEWREENPKVLIDLIGADLRGSKLNEADLHGANLSEAKLYGANLSGANLFKANLMDVKLRGMFPGEVYTGTEFDSVKLCNACLREAKLHRANLNGADLRAADLSGAILTAAHLHEADLRGARLVKTNFGLAVLSGADFRKAELCGAIFCSTILDRVNLSGACLPEINLIGSILSDANISKAYLRDAKLNQANFKGANLFGSDLNGADLSWAVLSGADLRGANLSRTNLGLANLEGADMRNADLFMSLLVETNLDNANITDCRVYGVSAWGLKLNGTEQRDLVITPSREPIITVDNLEVAQFIYLLLHNEKIRDVIDTAAKKVVLILGRFSIPERKATLDAIREELRKHDYLPVLFDFEKPASRDLSETISTLAHIARFIIADITDAKSIPAELKGIVPNLPSVPVVPLVLRSDGGYALFDHIRQFNSVLDPYQYDSQAELIEAIEERIIAPAEAKLKELNLRKITQNC